MLLRRLIDTGGYHSERHMALALGFPQETVYAFRRARRRPNRWEAFTLRYAEVHGVDWRALLERWELVAD
jgi:hypothetical protein